MCIRDRPTPARLFHIAHHDGLQPTQHVAVWSLPPKGGSEGPNLHRAQHHARLSSYLKTTSRVLGTPFLRKLTSIASSRLVRSNPRSRARSCTSRSGSSSACSRRYLLTQLVNVPSFMACSRATCAAGRDVSMTNLTNSSLNSGEYCFLLCVILVPFRSDPHRSGLPVRHPPGYSGAQVQSPGPHSRTDLVQGVLA